MSEISVKPIGRVRGARDSIEDDAWGGVTSTIELDPEQLEPDALDGLDGFSHVEVVFVLDRVDPDTVCRGARHPRGRADWPAVGILAQRGKDRPNRIGVTVCRLRALSPYRLEVSGLDAVDDTPVLDVKPYMSGFAPRGPVREPDWSHELMDGYWYAEGDRSGIERLRPHVVSAHGSPAKDIHEFIGMASTGDDGLSLAVMHSPAGWTEPDQITRFSEISVVIEGSLALDTPAGPLQIEAGEAVLVPPGTPVCYATPEAAVYISLCRPAFRPDRLARGTEPAR